MEKTTCTNLTDVVRSVQLLKVNGYSMTKTMDCEEGCIKSRWNVDGYDWEIRLYSAGLPGNGGFYSSWIAVELVFLSEARARNVKATLGYRLVDPIPIAKLNKFSEERRHTVTFKNPHLIIETSDLERWHYIKDDSFTVQCTITVLNEIPDLPTISAKEVEVPSSNLHEHLGDLLKTGTGADVTFVVSGESFAAHKAILAARSPVLMAEFFGQSKEKSSRRVEIKVEGEEPIPISDAVLRLH
ncbi:hypothetical protein ACQ4PT_008424 [Festuca glaucescens]